jgi:hypothetical protein
MIPVVDDLASDPLVHRFGDCFNPPGLTNFIGCVQADIDVLGIRSLNFPPFACSDTTTAGLYIDSKYFPSTGCAITFRWFPDRIERSAEYEGLKLTTTTVLAVGKTAALVRLRIENRSGAARKIALKLRLRGGITKAVRPWTDALPPTEADNVVEIERGRSALLFRARKSPACVVQGCLPEADEITPNGLRYSVDLATGKNWELCYVAAIGETDANARSLFDALARDVPTEIARAKQFWDDELRAVFTPGNDRYSGHMPTLETSDVDVLQLYHTGILGTIYFKRDTPHSAIGRTYTTLLPRYWQTATFLWDYSLSSLVHALLDPHVMRKHLGHWMHTDIHKCFGTEYLTGAGIGQWYSVNDFAMTVIARDYLRWTGDLAWLDATVPSAENGDRKVIELLERYASNWKRFRTASGLADYGELNNLLECVSTYLHEVASLNAANVFNMRTVAELLAMRGRTGRAAELVEEANTLVREVRKLYAPGRGFWHARFPDGRLVEVRHAYDFITVLNRIADDLAQSEKSEMAAFFQRELQTPTWMHALSPDDDDAMFSVRPDHQWTGAYPAWPPQAVTGLYKIGRGDIAFRWLKGLARSANQGPFGQAHFVERAIEPEAGGARKAPPDWPYITDWTCSSNGAWCNIVIKSLFGLCATFDKGLTANPNFGDFDGKAVLRNLTYQGKQFTVTKKGIAT